MIEHTWLIIYVYFYRMNWHSQIHYTQNGNARKLNTPIEIMEKENKTDLRYKLEMDFVSYKIFFISILMLIAKKKVM